MSVPRFHFSSLSLKYMLNPFSHFAILLVTLSLTHSLTHLLTHSPTSLTTHSLTYLTHSHIHTHSLTSLTHPPHSPLTHSPTSLSHTFTLTHSPHSLTHLTHHSLTHSPTSLTHTFTLTHSPHSFTHLSLAHSLTYSLIRRDSTSSRFWRDSKICLTTVWKSSIHIKSYCV